MPQKRKIVLFFRSTQILPVSGQHLSVNTIFTTTYQENMVTNWRVISMFLRPPCSMDPTLPLHGPCGRPGALGHHVGDPCLKRYSENQNNRQIMIGQKFRLIPGPRVQGHLCDCGTFLVNAHVMFFFRTRIFPAFAEYCHIFVVCWGITHSKNLLLGCLSVSGLLGSCKLGIFGVKFQNLFFLSGFSLA